MLDKSVEYFGIVMLRENQAIKIYDLPKGYSFKFYTPGDEIHWADLEVSVDEFKKREDAVKYFKKEYDSDTYDIKERCFFVLDAQGHYVATATAWHGELMGHKMPRVHWISVHPDHQGKGLCKAMMTKLLEVFQKFDESEKIFLTSQTWSYKAINIYKQMGFIPYDDHKKGIYQGSMDSFACDFEKSWLIIDQKLLEYARSRN